MSPTASTSGCPVTARSAPTGMRPPCCRSRRSDTAIGFASSPAPQTSVWASSVRPDSSVTPRWGYRRDHLPQRQLDPPLLELVPRVLLELGLEHRENGLARLDQGELGLGDRELWIVLREVAAIELGQRPDRLDAGRPAADDHDVQRPGIDQRGIAVRGLPPAKDVCLQPHRIVQRVHGEGVLGGALHPEEGGASAEGKDQVVVVDRVHLLEGDAALGQIHRARGRLVDDRVGLIVE